MPIPICLRLFTHLARRPCSFALAKAGKSMEARIAMIAITTSNSMSVNAPDRDRRGIMRASSKNSGNSARPFYSPLS
jgi:hypothetical protein